MGALPYVRRGWAVRLVCSGRIAEVIDVEKRAGGEKRYLVNLAGERFWVREQDFTVL